ncbi:MAG: hypothetical protein WBF39_04090 [Planococcus donghaensis]
MKIMNRKEFLSLPNGILFRKYEPCVFEDMQIKTESHPNDFVCISLDWVKTDNSRREDYTTLSEAKNAGKSFEFDYGVTYRDGLYDEDQLFAVYEQKDINDLIAFLKESTVDYPIE